MLAIAAVIVAVAGIVRGFSGFGSALVMSPALSLLFGPPAAIATMTLMEVPTLVQLLPDAWRHGDRRSFVPLGLAAVIMVPVGAWLLVHLDELVMRRAIGLLVLGFTAVLGTGWRYRGTVPLPLTLGVGASGDLLGGAMGIAGPPIILFYMSGPASARVARGSMIGFFAFTTVTALFTYGWYGPLYRGRAVAGGGAVASVRWRNLAGPPAVWPRLGSRVSSSCAGTACGHRDRGGILIANPSPSLPHQSLERAFDQR